MTVVMRPEPGIARLKWTLCSLHRTVAASDRRHDAFPAGRVRVIGDRCHDSAPATLEREPGTSPTHDVSGYLRSPRWVHLLRIKLMVEVAVSYGAGHPVKVPSIEYGIPHGWQPETVNYMHVTVVVSRVCS